MSDISEKKRRVPAIRFKGFTDDWEQRKLGQIAEIVGGGTPSTGKSEYWDGDIDWYAPAEIGTQRYVQSSQKKITDAGLKSSSARMLPSGTVLFTSRAGIGKTAILEKEASTNQGFQSIVPVKNQLDSYFIFSRTEDLKRYGEVNGAGSTFVEVSGKTMAKMPINIPSMVEQQQIGQFFQRLDDTIALHQRKYESLQTVKKELLRRLFASGKKKVPDFRFQGFNDDWEQRKLGDIALFLNGRAYKQDELLDSGKYPVLRVGNFNTNDKWYYSDLQLPSKNYADAGDLLYTWATAFGPHIWKGTRVIYHYHIGKVEPTKDLSKKFAVHLLDADQAQMTNSLNGSTMVHITKGTMENKVVSIPTVTEQDKIADILDTLDHTIALHQQQLENLKQLKKVLLQKLFV